MGGSAIRLPAFNRLNPEAAVELFRPCLNVERWLVTVVGRRPYAAVEDLFEVARDAAYPFTGAELEAAVAHRHSFTPRPLAPQQLSAGRRLRSPTSQQQQALPEVIRTYEERFGRPFLIQSAGRSSQEIFANLHSRLSNDSDTEDLVLTHHLRQLTPRPGQHGAGLTGLAPATPDPFPLQTQSSLR